jgi:adenylate cyclase
MEIERKFLVSEVPATLKPQRVLTLSQGYLRLPEGKNEVRIRRSDDGYYLTVKSGVAMVRQEVEVAISSVHFDAIWPLTLDRRISKSRQLIAYREHTIELDVFTGSRAGLVIAEVEFQSVEAAQAFQPPDWFGREVTDDPAFANRNLAG